LVVQLIMLIARLAAVMTGYDVKNFGRNKLFLLRKRNKNLYAKRALAFLEMNFLGFILSFNFNGKLQNSCS